MSKDARIKFARASLDPEIARTSYRVRVSISFGWPVVLALAVLLAVTVVADHLGRIPLAKDSVVAGARAILQLSVVALVITAVVDVLALSLLAVLAMFVLAAVTTSRRVEAPNALGWTMLALACGIVPSVGTILATGAIPLTGIALIPVAGIVIGNTMTVHTLVGRRVFAALREERDQYEAGLSIGLPSSAAIDLVIARRVPEGIVPSIDQVRTSGLVTLPGAFIGVMLGGGSAADAATAQVLVLFAIMAAQAITAGVQARLVRARRLLPPDLSASLVP